MFFVFAINTNLLAQDTLFFYGERTGLKSSHISYFQDRNNTYTVNSVLQMFRNSSFKKSSSNIPNFGYKKSPYWFIVTFVNRSENTIILLELDFAHYNEVDLYVFNNSFQKIFHNKQGVINLRNEEEKRRNTVFEVEAELNEVNYLFFRIKNEAPIVFPLFFHTNNSYFKKETSFRDYSSFLFGLIIAIVFFDIIFFFITRIKAYFYLALAMLLGFGNFFCNYLGAKI
jgi:two-component system, sensor histidine kinase LadS